MNSTFTTEELIISRMAHEFKGEIVALGATVCSDIAARLAKRLHNPDLLLIGGSFAAWDCPSSPKLLNDEMALVEVSAMGMDWSQNFKLVSQSKLMIWLGPVQLDASGSSNISVIGPWSRPDVQLVGARGIPDNLWGLSDLFFHVRQHSPRTFVESVDFVCGRGYGEVRDELSLETGRPRLVVSDLGVFGWDPASDRMCVESLHPGVSPAEVVQRTGFQLNVPSEVRVTTAPTDEELALIREELDPLGLRRLDASQTSPDLLQELVEAERDFLGAMR